MLHFDSEVSAVQKLKAKLQKDCFKFWQLIWCLYLSFQEGINRSKESKIMPMLSTADYLFIINVLTLRCQTLAVGCSTVKADVTKMRANSGSLY